jgi:hypothetical protein
MWVLDFFMGLEVAPPAPSRVVSTDLRALMHQRCNVPGAIAQPQLQRAPVLLAC